jgi:succinate-semialdehyde dehydrogenase/glutarate-semialdehyde dehydrogenase
MAIASINPATAVPAASFIEIEPSAASAALEAADRAFGSWRSRQLSERASLMRRAAGLLRDRAAGLAAQMAEEMGKPVAQGRAEVEKCAGACDYYAERSSGFLEPLLIPTEATRSLVLFQPLGVVLAIMPWNFPFWQVIRAAAPALMAGNTMVLKHASNVPACALAIHSIFQDAGFPEGVFTTLLAGSSQVEALIAHPAVQAVTLTGSTPAGRAVASTAGRHLKKTVLELGGSDPYLVLEDADLDYAAATCAASRMINGGQSCIAAKRFIVAESVLGRFLERFVPRMQSYAMGNPLDETCTLGPMARVDLRDELHDQVVRSARSGAQLLCGGTVPPGPGAYYPPTVLAGIEPGMAAYSEETFGPVAAVIAAKDEEEAVRIANDTVFGLGAAVFTRNLERGERIASELRAGCCFVNDFVRSDPRLPFGGVRESGYGRELSSFGLREFVNVKTVVIQGRS